MVKEIVFPQEVRKALKFPCATLMDEKFLRRVIFSSKVKQPVLCFGRLMEHGWGISSSDPLTVQGRIGVIRDEDEN